MDFLKTFLAALLAFIVANILIAIFVIMIFVSIASFSLETAPALKSDSVLRIDLSNGITDSPDQAPFNAIGFGGLELNNSNSILEVLDAIENAVYDANIKGIYINLGGGSISTANVEELRRAISQFRDESDKFVVSYSDVYSQFGYYLASVSDAVFVHPEGGVSWQGLSSQVMFYKGLLDKLGLEVEILRHGTFKSAVEPFMLDKMSPENRLQLNTVLESIWQMMLADVADSRGLNPDTLSEYASNLSIYNSKTALDCGMVDAMLYEDQVHELLGRLASDDALALDTELRLISSKNSQVDPATQSSQWSDDLNTDDVEDIAEDEIIRPDVTVVELESPVGMAIPTPRIIDLKDYISVTKGYASGSRNKVAVIYIDGDIVDGKGGGGSVGNLDVAEKLSQARKDTGVKSVVIRVNSPGGSALSSENMWREIELLRKDKPIVVSMGGYAASGGYYVSCPADIIITNRSTLTGSIGVFGLMLNMGKTLKDKLGITVDVVNTNPHADMGSSFRAMSATEREFFMKGVEQVYSTFVEHVSAGRNMSFEDVDNIGQGRVWSGANAVEIGLADGFGGLKDAINIAAERAGVTGNFRVTEIVDTPDSFSMLIRSFYNLKTNNGKGTLGEAFKEYENLLNAVDEKGIQARMLYRLEIE